MKILSDEQIREYYLGMRLSAVQRVCEAQARETHRETLKAVGEWLVGWCDRDIEKHRRFFCPHCVGIFFDAIEKGEIP